MDLHIANWIYKTFGSNEVVLKIAKFITHFGDAVSIITIITLLLIFQRTRKVGFYAAVSVLIAFLINNFVLKVLIARERPFEANAELLNAIKLADYKISTDYSMPSGHSLASMTLAVAIFMHNKKFGTLAICMSVVIGITRMILCVHYLTDVLVGFALGVAFAIAIYYLLNLIIKKYLKRKEIKNENYSSRNQ